MLEIIEQFKYQIGVTGSPNTVNSVYIHITQSVLEEDFELEGTLIGIPFNNKLVIAQLRGLESRNRWHENEQLGAFIALKGNLPHLTGDADVYTCRGEIIGVYKYTDKWYQETLGIPLGTGNKAFRLNNEIVHKILDDVGYGRDFYIGKFYGLDTAFPADLRSYGAKSTGGHGEAYMGGIFGPSGSGKSVMLTNMIAGFAKNKTMGMLVLDPQGEFANNKMHKPPEFELNLHQILTEIRPATEINPFIKERDIIHIRDIRITDLELFVKLLKLNGFFSKLSIKKTEEVMDEVNDLIQKQESITGGSLLGLWDNLENKNIKTKDGVSSFMELIVEAIARSYAEPDKYKERFYDKWQSDLQYSLKRIWDISVKFFLKEEKQSIRDIIYQIVESGRIVILDVSDDSTESEEKFKKYMINYVMKQFRSYSKAHYTKKSGSKADALVIIDEAHLFAGNSNGSEIDKELSRTMAENVAMLRKQNCGMFLSTQFITQLRQEIFRQLHYRIYASGLIGPDKEWMKDKEGIEGVDLYEKLPDPKQSGRYCYLIGGNLASIGSMGKPMMIEGLKHGEIDIRKYNKI